MGKIESINWWFENLVSVSSILKLDPYLTLKAIIDLEYIQDLNIKHETVEEGNMGRQVLDNDILAIVQKSLAKPTKNSYNGVISHQSAPACQKKHTHTQWNGMWQFAAELLPVLLIVWVHILSTETNVVFAKHNVKCPDAIVSQIKSILEIEK